METVQSLREAGNRVSVTHFRWYKSSDGMMLLTRRMAECLGVKKALQARGGATVVQIREKIGAIPKVGVARCHTIDPFNRKRALKIAVARALSGEDQ